MTNIAVPVPAETVPVPATTVDVPASTVSVLDATLAALLTAAGWTCTPPGGSAPRLALYDGSNWAAIEALATTLGVKLAGLSMYSNGSTWATIANPWGGTSTGGPPPALAAGQDVILSVDLTPNNTGLAAVPGNLSAFVTLAKALIGIPTIIRLGWEFDIPTGPWGAGAKNSSGQSLGNTPALYVAAWQAVVPAMKAVNPSLKFDWCCNSGTSSLAQLEAYYPGDQYVDFIGGDHYDPGAGNLVAAMGACITLAAQRGKPLSIGEWGEKGKDNPAFAQAMGQLILDLPAACAANGWPVPPSVAYHSYFNAQQSIMTSWPNFEAEYKALFA